MYAAGKIPGSFFKREGRAGEKAHADRAHDRPPAAPAVPQGLAPRDAARRASRSRSTTSHPYDILAMNGASAALMVSDIPFPAPVGAVRIGKVDGNFVVNPTEEAAARRADLDLVVAGTEEAILMVEAGANEIPEAEILDALDIAHSEIKKLVRRAARAAPRRPARPRSRSRSPQVDEDLLEQIAGSHGAALDEATQVEDKLERQDATKAVEEEVLDAVLRRPETPRRTREYRGSARSSRSTSSRRRSSASASPSTRSARTAAAADEIRADLDRGRRRCRARTAPALFTRGQTQALSRRRARHHARGDAPRHARAGDVQALLPPLQLPAVLGGRGRLHARPEAPRHRPRRARRARAGADDPVARRTSRTRSASSRTSSSPTARRSMASVCGSSLSLMDAGVPIKRAGRRHRDGPDQGGRRLRRAHRHRRRRGPPRRHGLQGRRHRERHHRAADGHQDHGRHVRHPARRARAGQGGRARSSSARWPRSIERAARASCRSTRRASPRSRSTRTRSAC